MRPVILVPAVISVLLVMNVAWFVAYDPPVEALEEGDLFIEWEPLPDWSAPQGGLSQKLLATGRWGEVLTTESADDEVSRSIELPPGELTKAEERELLGRLLGIVIRGDKRAIFNEASAELGHPVSVAEGERIPETRWQIISIEADRISLTDYQEEGVERNLESPVELHLYKVVDEPVETPNVQ